LATASVLGAACNEDDGGASAGSEACERVANRFRECGLIGEGDADCKVTEEVAEEADCLQGCMERAECATLSTLLCTGDVPSSDDAATLNTCFTRCSEQFGFHCTGALGGDAAVPTSFVCDGQEDCADGADELGCERFDCGNGETIVSPWVCDGVPDCSNRSDEGTGCPHFSCGNGNLVPEPFVCDGDNDCGDGSDEAGCNIATLLCP
jgi:hypothetical protein